MGGGASQFMELLPVLGRKLVPTASGTSSNQNQRQEGNVMLFPLLLVQQLLSSHLPSKADSSIEVARKKPGIRSPVEQATKTLKKSSCEVILDNT